MLGPISGLVAVVTSWLIAIPRIRILAEEMGADISPMTRVLVDHAGLITMIAIVIATVGIVAIKLVRRGMVRMSIALATTVILFGHIIWDIVVFWLIYVATVKGIG